ncbi:hypothetical protein SNE40_010625 [Patella caerulea]|uniref:Integrator complex subunit 7 n=1 Tax=Patella caerulea TaxID=87958 RepID=A0AAN8K298_PATCE
MAASMSNSRNMNSSISENVTAEQEQDANSALTELDKGLRSIKIGNQCEAVVKFPKLFEKYPFPILINSALLKLADVFRGGNNFIRLCILKVTQQSEKHLDKIINVDEFIKRIFTVLHSNDPVARAITLRTLGSIACIISEKKNVHHSIVLSLDSHDAVEVEAAIFAANHFSAVSKIFAAGICSKIAEMISGLATPVDMKLQLIPIFQHMHHDITTASKAWKVCTSLLEGYPACRFVLLTLDTMTQLAVKSLFTVQQHVQLLLSYLQTDCRQAVKIICLNNLKQLAKISSHLWRGEYIESISDFMMCTPSIRLKIFAVNVLNTICNSVAIQLIPILPEAKLKAVCQEYCYHDNLTLSTRTVQLMTVLAKSGRLNNEISEEITMIQTHLILLISNEKCPLKELKLSLQCAVQVCQASPQYCGSFVETMANLLPQAQGKHAELLCESLAAVGDDNSQNLQGAVPNILSYLSQSIETSDISNTRVFLCTLLFQAARGAIIPNQIKDLILHSVESSNHWFAYKIVRQAMRYSQCGIAEILLHQLKKEIASENLYYWLTALEFLSQIEMKINSVKADNSNLLKCSSEALELYQKALVALKAGSNQSFSLKFPIEYISVRIQLLQAHQQLLLTCNTFRTSPPPAIASALAATNGQDSARWSQIIGQLEKCVQEYEELSVKISELHWSSFDADPLSLQNVDILQQSCDVIKSSITTIVSLVHTGVGLLGERRKMHHTSDKDLDGSIRLALQQISVNLDTTLHTTPVSDMTSKIEFLSSSAKLMLQASHPYPRYFFQSLQSTAVKLAVSPQQNIHQEPISIRCDTHMTLKVEGVIQHNDSLYRQVKSVTITAKTNLQSRSSATSTNNKMNEATSQFFTRTVEPHNDYFCVNFLLPFPALGIHGITIEAAIIDENGATWNTGPKETLTVKSYDDMILRQQQQARFQRLTQH